MKSSTLNIPTARAFAPLLVPSRYKGAYGGRGSGKSHFFAELLIDEHIANGGMRSVCIREVQKSLEQSAKRLIEDKIIQLGVSHLFEVKRDRIHTPNDGLIIFQGMQNHTADSIKSLEGFDRAWVEEAQSLSQRSLDLLRPTIRKDASELWFSWNPQKATDPIDRFLRSGVDNSCVISANYFDNPWFPNVLEEEMQWDKRRDPDKYKHVWLGEYISNSEARVFHNWTIDEFESDADHYYFGADWGFAIDPTVLVRCFIKGRELFIDHEVYKVGCPIDKTPDLFMKVPESTKYTITGDSARPETIEYMRRHGFPKMQRSRKGKGSVNDGIEFLKNYDIIVHPRCKHTIDELSLYSYKVDRLTGEILPEIADDKNHVIDALRYALESTRRAVKSETTAAVGMY